MNDRLLIVVPARGGSKRLPGKHLRPLGGRTLLEWTAEAITEAAIDAPCLLTTDDAKIAEAGRTLGWIVPWLRPASLATDEAPTLPAVLHAVDWFAGEHGGDPEFVMLLQATSPFRGGVTLQRGLDMLAGDPEVAAVVAVRDLHRTAETLFSCNANGHLVALGGSSGSSGSSGSTTVLTPNGALYLVRTRELRAVGTLYPEPTIPLLMEETPSLDIDTVSDWALAESMLAQGVATAGSHADATLRSDEQR
jgi:CMP-N,N'-diacetyllegionaminic acid synthase